MGDLEQKCEEALYVLCDLRQRYPSKCANELEKCIRLTSDICMSPPPSIANATPTITPFTPEQNEFLDAGLAKKDAAHVFSEEDVQKMLDKIDNLRAVTAQINRDKTDTRFTLA